MFRADMPYVPYVIIILSFNLSDPSLSFFLFSENIVASTSLFDTPAPIFLDNNTLYIKWI